MSNNKSKWAVIFTSIILLIAGSFFYPKWMKSGTEATISWDVSGYYFYLPSIFIYKDIKKLSFKDEILNKYKPTPDFQQAFLDKGDNYIMKYPAGQAIQMFPFFILAHSFSIVSDGYPADGFSMPYQFSIYFGGLLIAIIGLFYLRKILIQYYSDEATTWTIVLIVLGSNYLEYAGITNAMTHNNLFTLYTLLIYNTINFYKKPAWNNSIYIALLIGLMALTRPTEILAIIIPLTWGLSNLNYNSISKRLKIFLDHKVKIILASFVIFMIGSIQLIYWKFVSGNWLVYSYEDQGFSWLRPHIIDGLFSYKSGWLIYSPIFIFSIIGFYFLYKDYRKLFWPVLIFISLFIYVAFAWDIWWYGGSLGQRTMVQAYPMISFPLTAFIQWVISKKPLKWLFFILCLCFIYFNFWLVYQAHGGGLLKVSQMTKAYFWEVVGRYEIERDKLKLLDNKDYFEGTPDNPALIYTNDFESFKEGCFAPPISGKGSLCLPGGEHYSEEFRVRFIRNSDKWIRVSATFQPSAKEWEVWKMPQFIVKFYNNGDEVKARSIRLHRHFDHSEVRKIYMDSKVPNKDFEEIGVFFWNPGSPHSLLIDDLKIETF